VSPHFAKVKSVRGVGGTGVLPELLGATYAKLKPLFDADRQST